MPPTGFEPATYCFLLCEANKDVWLLILLEGSRSIQTELQGPIIIKEIIIFKSFLLFTFR